MLFHDRADAGRQLAKALMKYKEQSDTLLLGLARGGVAVAAEAAIALHLPLNVIGVRKVGAPGHEELALGAIAEEGSGAWNDHLIGLLGISEEYLQREIERQRKILKERLVLYRKNTHAPLLQDKTVILVDDGIATGASMRAAVASVRLAKAKKIVLAVPVASSDTLQKIAAEVDEVVCLSTPLFFEAVGAFYRIFDQVSDEEIIRFLRG